MCRRNKHNRIFQAMMIMLLVVCLFPLREVPASEGTQDVSMNKPYRHYAWYVLRGSERVLVEEGAENQLGLSLYAIGYSDDMDVESVLSFYYFDADVEGKPEHCIMTQILEGDVSQTGYLYYYNEDGSGYKKETYSEDNTLTTVVFAETDEHHNLIRDRIYHLDGNGEVNAIRDRDWSCHYENGVVRSAEIISRIYEGYIPDTEGLEEELPEEYLTSTTNSFVEYTDPLA